MRSCETMARLRSDALTRSGNTLEHCLPFHERPWQGSRVSISWSSNSHHNDNSLLRFVYGKLDIIQHLKIEKDKFLDEKHLDWYVLTFIRNYPEFLEDDYNNAMTLAKQHIADYEQLTQYIVELNNAYLSAKSYLGIE